MLVNKVPAVRDGFVLIIFLVCNDGPEKVTRQSEGYSLAGSGGVALRTYVWQTFGKERRKRHPW